MRVRGVPVAPAANGPVAAEPAVAQGVLSLRVQNLPTVVEGWKSLDDQNLVKCLDIGQALVAYPPGGAPPPAPRGRGAGAGPGPAAVPEARDGVGPGMRDARRRQFRQLPGFSPALVESVETDMLEILQKGAAQGETFEDVEEEWVDAVGDQPGFWRRVHRAIV